MSDLRTQFKEDQALRDAARSIILAQFARVRQGMSGQRLGEKLADKVGDDALDLLERTGEAIKQKRGLIAAAVAVVAGGTAVVFARKPIGDFISGFRKEESDEAAVLAEVQENDDA